MRRLTVSIMVAISVSLPALAWKDPREINASMSISQSVKHQVYLRNVRVTPVHFHWGGHEIDIKESWLERSQRTKSILCFSLLIDEKKEHWKNDEPEIDFRCESDCVLSVGRASVSMPWRQVHFIEFKNLNKDCSLPKTLSLRAKPNDSNTTSNEIDLIFDLEKTN